MKLLAEGLHLVKRGNVTIGNGGPAQFDGFDGSGIREYGNGLFDGFEVDCAENHSDRTSLSGHRDSFVAGDDRVDYLGQRGLDFGQREHSRHDHDRTLSRSRLMQRLALGSGTGFGEEG